jgi:hypothetical protein
VIYRSIYFYRLAMEVLYTGRYRARFFPVCRLIRGNKVTELCFGDTLIARFCIKKNITWSGFDINENFVRHALSRGYSATYADLRNTMQLPPADTVVICGSLYHFKDHLEDLLRKMLDASSYIIISEPVINLSSRSGIIGKLAKGSADVAGDSQEFRYTESSLLQELTKYGEMLGFTVSVKDRISKDLILTLEK